MKRKWPTDDVEISGFGPHTDYELTCRAMFLAGVEWLDAHHNETPHLIELVSVTGLVAANNDAGCGLLNAIIGAKMPSGEAVEPTGAMVQVVSRWVLWVMRYGWDKTFTQARQEQHPNSIPNAPPK